MKAASSVMLALILGLHLLSAQDEAIPPAPVAPLTPQPVPATLEPNSDSGVAAPSVPSPAEETIEGEAKEGVELPLDVSVSSSVPLGEVVPEALREWIPWVRRGASDPTSPPLYDDSSQRLPLWPGRLSLDLNDQDGTFKVAVTIFQDAWFPLPGGGRIWPTNVASGGESLPVVEHEGNPAVRLAPGQHEITGAFQWQELPEQLALPAQIGLLSLRLNGTEHPAPNWGHDGVLRVQQQVSAEPVDEDTVSSQVFTLLEDGVPLWYTVRLELIVSGKNREEILGNLLPEGWSLAEVQSALPVAVNQQGLVRAQVRAGRWVIEAKAFRHAAPEAIGYAEGAAPITSDQTLSYRSRTEFRQADIEGLVQVDVSQTQVPESWKHLPIYRWESDTAFKLVERVRGPGQRAAGNLSVQRSLWLDDDGRAFTYQDTISGTVREIDRLDVAQGHELGSVVVNAEPQLITHHPQTEATGFEVRAPQLTAVATGRAVLSRLLPASGWRMDVDSLSATLQLPPGYRMLLMTGVDHSSGDWLRAWSLLDLFFLMLFTLAVFRVRGWWAGLLALLAFGLAYHEPGAPKVPWLLLLVPVALLNLLPSRHWRSVTQMAKWIAVAILLLEAVPFIGAQVQGAIYPQLEKVRESYYPSYVSPASVYEAAMVAPSAEREDSYPETSRKAGLLEKSTKSISHGDISNMKWDASAVIQTEPGVPTWTWRQIDFGWDGPVGEEQQFRAYILPPSWSRPLSILRALLVVLLATVLLLPRKGREKEPRAKGGARPASPPPASDGATAVSDSAAVSRLAQTGTLPGMSLWILGGICALWLGFPQEAAAQYPSQALLQELKTYLEARDDTGPVAAVLAKAALKVEGSGYQLELEYHGSGRTAVPVPVPLGGRSSGLVRGGEGAEVPLLRHNEQLWVLLPASGIHRFTVEGTIRDVADWEWAFSLRPRQVTVDAPEWNITGIRPDATTEDQVLFSKIPDESNTPAAATGTNYGQSDLKHAVLVKRSVELGLVWRARTTVRRLSPTGRSIGMQVPTLSGEKIVSHGLEAREGKVSVQLPPDQTEFSWESELVIADTISWQSPDAEAWNERWVLQVSPVWNVDFEGLAPVFEHQNDQLVSVWTPWPGESALVKVSRPTPAQGAAITVDAVLHEFTPGRRLRNSSLDLTIRSSLGQDFPIQLPAEAEITNLTHQGKSAPVRKDGDSVVVNLQPGSQTVRLEWRTSANEGLRTQVDAVQLPVESANITTRIHPRRDQWLLWMNGPLRGPAVLFWGVLLVALLAGVVLSRLPVTPLTLGQWLLLTIGLTQAPVILSLLVVAWLLLLQWRGSERFRLLGVTLHNTLQVVLIGLTFISVLVFVYITSSKLLGTPNMMIRGDGSHANLLNWLASRADSSLPEPGYYSISLWWFRGAILLWALWLAASLIRWLRLGWRHSQNGGHFKMRPPRPQVPKTRANAEPRVPPALPKEP